MTPETNEALDESTFVADQIGQDDPEAFAVRKPARTKTSRASRRGRRRRFLTFTAVTAAFALLASGAAAVAVNHKLVTLDVNGKITQISTFAGKVSDIIDTQNVAIGEHDALIPGYDVPLSDGLEIKVRKAHYVTVAVNGEPASLWTTAANAQQVLAMFSQQSTDVAMVGTVSGPRVNFGIPLTDSSAITVVADGVRHEVNGYAYDAAAAMRSVNVVANPADRVSITLDPIHAGGVVITVQRVVTEEVTTVSEIPFESITQENDEMYTGTSKVTQDGVPGEHTLIEKVVTVDGVEESREVIFDEVTLEPVSKITEKGTKKRPVVVAPSSSGGGGGGGVSAPAVPAVSPGSAQAIAQSMMASSYGWGDDQFACLVSLWQKESGWNVYSHNTSSGAYGIPQALPGSKMAAFGADWQTNPATQIAWGLSYISGRYGDPCGAWNHFLAKRWY